MDHTNGLRVLAIAVDAAEPSFVRHLIDRDEMPALKSLLSSGKWLRVKSPAGVGSASVWPTFIAGQSPNVHGVYGEWLWDASTMSLNRYHSNHVTPFWKSLLESGVSVGVMDIPFMPLIGVSNGFEISEWGPHDIVDIQTMISPDSIANVVEKYSPHPLQTHVEISGPHDYEGLEKVGNACLHGVTARGNLARALLSETQPQFTLIGFTEIHHSAHYLWHKVEPDHRAYKDGRFADLATTRPAMIDIYRELDRQIAELMTGLTPETYVMVFSLHGMRPAHGTPSFLAPWLCELGFARLLDWRTQSWRDRARSGFANLKRHSPAAFKKFYYKMTPRSLTYQLARPTILPRYDWQHTRAFALPTDQHGWIRVNLIGREARGIVPADRYEETCEQLDHKLRALRNDQGDPLTHEVIRTAPNVDTAMGQRLPDIVVHWTDAVFASPLRIAGSKIQAEPTGQKYVGQHSLEGFCIVNNAKKMENDEVRAENFSLLITRMLDCKSMLTKQG
jgi:predicted AlkP superfamily phosphohydrolase/phosphomutase